MVFSSNSKVTEININITYLAMTVLCLNSSINPCVHPISSPSLRLKMAETILSLKTKLRMAHPSPLSFQRRKKKKKEKKEALPHNLSKSVQVGPLVDFSDYNYWLINLIWGRGGAFRSENFKIKAHLPSSFSIPLKANDVLSDRKNDKISENYRRHGTCVTWQGFLPIPLCLQNRKNLCEGESRMA